MREVLSLGWGRGRDPGLQSSKCSVCPTLTNYDFLFLSDLNFLKIFIPQIVFAQLIKLYLRNVSICVCPDNKNSSIVGKEPSNDISGAENVMKA